MEKELVAFAKRTRKKFPPADRVRKPGLKARLSKLSGIRLVLFDLYGTAFIANQHSESEYFQKLALKGFRETARQFNLVKCLEKIGSGKRYEVLLKEMFYEEIAKDHERRRAKGAESPDVLSEKIWERVLRKLHKQCGKPLPKNLEMVGLKCSYMSNWIGEPGMLYNNFLRPVQQLKKKGVILGIASNAQLYTKIDLDIDLQGKSRGKIKKWEQLFDPKFSAFSFEAGESKPSKRLFEKILRNAKKQGIKRGEIAFAGNDLYKDIAIGKELGFKTILFAGDQETLRLRKHDPRAKGVRADAIITDWGQVVKVLS
ncbi:MAG: HAD family hydrolase [Candidatus Diapherotrites archaeon]|uniref:HAD family hydrolase n=1 Tax=Candidatus Iainarchaeum sp. TaxID=3101447 RepID=A0A938YQM7_9ARCH|nr:HAD family hydrolase [Candidatus Diapherotrites archaeon]